MRQTHELLGHSDRNSALKQLPELRSIVNIPARSQQQIRKLPQASQKHLNTFCARTKFGPLRPGTECARCFLFACTPAQDGKTYIPVSVCML